MIIKTNKFQFPKYLYFSILLKSMLARSGWIILLVFSMAVYQGVKAIDSTVLILGALPLAFFLYLVIRCWIHSSSKKNALFYKERFFEIDAEYLVSFLEDGTTNKIKINNIARVVKKGGSYRLFLTRKQFIYIPLNAFRTPGDINRFDSILKARKREPILNARRKPSQ